MTELNGHAKDPTPPGDQIHTLLTDGIAQIAEDWVNQLDQVRKDATALENEVLACVAAAKDSLERLHGLGPKVAAEVTRIAKMREGVAQIAGERS